MKNTDKAIIESALITVIILSISIPFLIGVLITSNNRTKIEIKKIEMGIIKEEEEQK